jgi:DeoR family fructose operon transcriptional repressor
MNPLRRYEKIMEELLARREVTVAELSEILQVTGKTIREDLAKLEEKGHLIRVHGGAVLAQSDQLGLLSQKESLTRHPSEKAEIAAYAVSLIETGDIVALDGGSTTLEIAKHLENRPLTVVTNDVRIIGELAMKDQIRLVVPGGYRVRNMLTGSEAANFVRKLNIQKAFLSATGVHPEYGFSIYTGDFIDFKQALIETARVSCVVADHHKLGRCALLTFAQIKEIDILITDSGVDSETVDQYRSLDIRVMSSAQTDHLL